MIGKKIYNFAETLWPINRSLTGDGVRETLLEIKKYIPTGTIDKKKIKIGCEITFNKYFYNYEEPLESKEVLNDIMKIDKEINETTKKILG